MRSRITWSLLLLRGKLGSLYFYICPGQITPLPMENEWETYVLPSILDLRASKYNQSVCTNGKEYICVYVYACSCVCTQRVAERFSAWSTTKKNDIINYYSHHCHRIKCVVNIGFIFKSTTNLQPQIFTRKNIYWKYFWKPTITLLFRP